MVLSCPRERINLSYFYNLGRIQSNGRFIQYKDRRIVQEGLGQPDPLFESFGKMSDDAAPDLLQSAII